VPLNRDSVRGITHVGGTILGTTNRGNPLRYPTLDKNGQIYEKDRTDELVVKFKEHKLDAIIAIGGDGSLEIAHALFQKGVRIIGIPKTIDNDLDKTVITFGFDTAVHFATECLDRLHSTAEAHRRIMVVEVMGRYAGWIALNTGVSSTADVILIPEIPYDINNVLKVINKRFKNGKGHVIIVIAEGAKPKDGDVLSKQSDEVGNANLKLGGVARKLLEDLKAAGCDADMRETVLGHLQRGGVPIAFDRILATQFGVKAMELALEGNYGKMVAYQHPSIVAVPFLEAISKYNIVKPDSSLVNTARGIGMSFGDE